MAFTYDITTDRGRVRLLISDTDGTDYQFEDDEIDFFLTLGSSSVLMAASYALEAWSASITDSLKSEKIGDYSYSKDEAGKKMELAKKYKTEATEAPYLTWSEIDLTFGSGITAEGD